MAFHTVDVVGLKGPPTLSPAVVELLGGPVACARIRKCVDRFLLRNWAQLAAFGWRNYRAWGRGLIVSDTRDRPPQTYYVEAGDVRKLALGPPAAEALERALADYDPERAMVFLAWIETRTGNHLAFRLAAHDPPPPRAHVARGH